MKEKRLLQDELFALLQSAFTRAEIEEAQSRYEAYLRRYPDDAKYDLAHGLARAVAYLEDREREVARLHLSPTEIDEREALLRQRLPAYSNEREEADALRKIQTLTNYADDWLRRHPSDRHVLAFLSQLDAERETLRLFFPVLFDADTQEIPKWIK